MVGQLEFFLCWWLKGELYGGVGGDDGGFVDGGGGCIGGGGGS